MPPHMVRNLYSETELSIKLLLGKKTKKNTNISPFLATHTYIKLTLVSFFSIFFLHLSLTFIQESDIHVIANILPLHLFNELIAE